MAIFLGWRVYRGRSQTVESQARHDKSPNITFAALESHESILSDFFISPISGEKLFVSYDLAASALVPDVFHLDRSARPLYFLR